MFHRRSSLSGALGALAALLALPLAEGPARAATSCYNVSCGSCTPTPPAGASTLVAAALFPADGDHPSAFVDPGDGRDRRFIATQEGLVWVWDGTNQTLLATPFLDLRSGITDPVNAGGERGLLSLVADPEYTTTGRVYVYYTRGDGDIMVSRVDRSTGNPDVANLASLTNLLRIDHPATNHNGGWLAFGPDGFLYVSTGDGGGSCDGGQGTNGDGQINTTLLGKLLRLDVRDIDPGATAPECAAGVGAYEVPASNPFAGATAGCGEVWAKGLRNPFRFSFDRASGDIYIGDVGQNNFEEFDLLRNGMTAPVNFGWACREACSTSATGVSNCTITGCPTDAGTSCQFPRASGFWDPILCHTAGSGWHSAMGGYRYRGGRVPDLAGSYLYSDAFCGQVWRTTTLDPNDPAGVAATCWENGFGGAYGFGEDRLGELYVVVGGAGGGIPSTPGGRIDCIHNGGGCTWAGTTGLWDGFETGSFGRWHAVGQ